MVLDMEARRAAFEAAKRARQKEAVANSAASFQGGPQYEEIQYAPLVLGEDRVMRIVSGPLRHREHPYDAKRVWISMILGDDGKKFRCIWPDFTENRNWILNRVKQTILSFTKDKVTGNRIYQHAETHPGLFSRVIRNDSDSPYDKGWTPSGHILLNVIDRSLMKWHEENRHMAIISKKVTESANGNLWFEPGIPPSLYEMILDDIAEYSGDPIFYDIVLQKLKGEPWYKAYHPINDRHRLSESTLASVSTEPLTEEQMDWEAYDFDKLFPITAYGKIMKRLGQFIKKVDAAFNTTFYEELSDLVEMEAKEREEERTAEEPKKTVSVEDDREEDFDLDVDEPEPKPEEKPKKVKKVVKQNTGLPVATVKATGSWNGRLYSGFLDLSEEEQNLLVGVNADGSLVWDDSVDLCEIETGFQFPIDFDIDPYTGERY